MIEESHRASKTRATVQKTQSRERTGSEGTLDDARMACLTTNREHKGKRYTNEDKRHVVQLAMEYRPNLSDGAIAKLCKVSQPFASKIRATHNGYESRERTGADGRTYDTSNIGKNRSGNANADDDPELRTWFSL